MCIEMIQRRKIRNLIDFIIKLKIFSLPFLLLLLLLFYSIGFWIWVPLLKYDTIRYIRYHSAFISFHHHFIVLLFLFGFLFDFLPSKNYWTHSHISFLRFRITCFPSSAEPRERLRVDSDGDRGAEHLHPTERSCDIPPRWWLMGDWVSIAIMYFGIIWINYIKIFKRDILAIIWNKWWYQNVSVELRARLVIRFWEESIGNEAIGIECGKVEAINFMLNKFESHRVGGGIWCCREWVF